MNNSFLIVSVNTKESFWSGKKLNF